LISRGAVVAALDIAPLIEDAFNTSSSVGIICDVTSSEAVDAAVKATVLRFGGLDIVVTNAGTFPPGQAIEELDDETWRSTLDTNLTGHQRLLRAATPYLRLGVEPAVVVVASKNVPAPGPGAAAYSASKAGLTQLARVAALELGPQGVRVNVVHPNSVFDTGIWTTEVLENRARHYGITVEEYKRDNVLGVEVESVHVADMVCAMAGSLFSRTTGAQVPIDGGNERVI
jgi:NAD(P)-dependent dehydrogenase (short-subunit alcohol dehydrogenase family)